MPRGGGTSKRRAVIFDLDGTLLDTLADIAAAMNAALASFGFPPRTEAEYRFLVGEGMRALAEKALPADRRNPALVDDLTERMREIYGRGWDRQTQPYPGAIDTLDALGAQGVVLAVLSNKPHAFTLKATARFLGLQRFALVLGEGPETPRKPDPGGIERIVAELALAKDVCLYLGDTKTDMIAANRAGLFAVGAAWGFRPREELWAFGARAVIDRPQALLPLVADVNSGNSHKT